MRAAPPPAAAAAAASADALATSAARAGALACLPLESSGGGAEAVDVPSIVIKDAKGPAAHTRHPGESFSDGIGASVARAENED